MLLLNPLPQRLDTGATPTFAGLLAGDGTAAAPSISFASDSNTGFFNVSSGNVGFSSDGAVSLYFGAGGIIQAAGFTGYLSLAASGAISLIAGGTNRNITLTPSGTGNVYVEAAANTKLLIKAGGSDRLELQASGNDGYVSGPTGAIIFRTNGSTEAFRAFANQRIGIGTGATDSGNGILQLATHTTSAGGIGFGTEFSLFRQSATQITIGNAGQEIVSFYKVGAGMKLEVNGGSVASPQITANGDSDTGIYWALANDLRLVTGGVSALTLDGSQGALFAGNVSLAAGKSILFGGGTISNIYSATDGVIVIANNANTGFTRLCFGPATASFPALRRVGTTIEAVLSDVSDYANFGAKTFTIYNGPTISQGVGSPEGLVTAPTGSIYLNTSGGASTSLYVKTSGAGNTGWTAK